MYCLVMNNANSNVFESFSADYTMTIQHAVRADGQWFTRIKSRHPMYGYRWSAWRVTSTQNPEAWRRVDRKVRLPK